MYDDWANGRPLTVTRLDQMQHAVSGIGGLGFRPIRPFRYGIFKEDSTYYRVDGLDGAMDDSGTNFATLLQSAINAIDDTAGSGGLIYLYPLASDYYDLGDTGITLDDADDGIVIQGGGMPWYQSVVTTEGVTLIRYTGAGSAFTFGDGTADLVHCGLMDLGVVAKVGAADTAVAVTLDRCKRGHFTRIFAYDMAKVFYLHDTSHFNVFYDCYDWLTATVAVHTEQEAGDGGQPNGNLIDHCYFNPAPTSIKIEEGHGNTIRDSLFQYGAANTSHNIHVMDDYTHVIRPQHFDWQTVNAVYLDNSVNTLRRCTINVPWPVSTVAVSAASLWDQNTFIGPQFQRSGTMTITSAGTTISGAHSLAARPSWCCVNSKNPSRSLGNLSWSAGGTNLYIVSDNAAAGGDATVSWHCGIGY
jgi:hypothetical protein